MHTRVSSSPPRANNATRWARALALLRARVLRAPARRAAAKLTAPATAQLAMPVLGLKAGEAGEADAVDAAARAALGLAWPCYMQPARVKHSAPVAPQSPDQPHWRPAQRHHGKSSTERAWPWRVQVTLVAMFCLRLSLTNRCGAYDLQELILQVNWVKWSSKTGI